MIRQNSGLPYYPPLNDNQSFFNWRYLFQSDRNIMNILLRGILIIFIVISFSSSQIVADYEFEINQNASHTEIKSIFVEDISNIKQSNTIVDWEKRILKSGFDLVTRSKIEAIVNEQALQLSGLTDNDRIYKVGQIVGADAVLFVKEYIIDEFSGMWQYEIQLVAVNTSQVLFISSYTAFMTRAEHLKLLKVNDYEVLHEWFGSIIDTYRNEAKKFN